jgi:hypothetical protein
MPTPVITYGFKEGNSHHEAALKFQASQNVTQSNLNSVARGGKSNKRKSHRRSKSHKRKSKSHRRSKSHKSKRKSKSHRRIRYKGGNGNIGLPKTVVVPQFPLQGPPVSPVNANSSSIGGNTTAIEGLNNATNDCYASGSCGKVGGKKKSRKQRK